MNNSPCDLPSQPAPVHPLEKLAEALDRRDFATTLTTGHNRTPQLTVTSRHTHLGDNIYTDHTAFWWSWAQPIAPLHDPQAAAATITHVLHTTPPPTHG